MYGGGDESCRHEGGLVGSLFLRHAGLSFSLGGSLPDDMLKAKAGLPTTFPSGLTSTEGLLQD